MDNYFLGTTSWEITPSLSVVLAPASSHSNATERVQAIGGARTGPPVPVFHSLR
jgi:hypothetical protein